MYDTNDIMHNLEHYRHLFFDMDKTIAPSRQLILPEMHHLLSSLKHDIVIASGQEVSKIYWQSKDLVSFTLGQNGNHATDLHNIELWNDPLTDSQKNEILEHIHKLISLLPEQPQQEWNPIEDRGAQITFSPIGNTAPVEMKLEYDPNQKKRFALLEAVPFESEELVVKIGGSTSLDYIHKDRHKGTNVARLINKMGWSKKQCVYFGDGLFPGGNDEAVIGVIDTIPVNDHLHTYEILKDNFLH